MGRLEREPSNWAGEWTDILHSDMQYRSPALTSDVTYLDGEVTAIETEEGSGQPVATVRVTMSNQDAAIMASGEATLRLPTETQPTG